MAATIDAADTAASRSAYCPSIDRRAGVARARGVFVTVNMRGGAEYGRRGTRQDISTRNRTFDDFIAVASTREGAIHVARRLGLWAIEWRIAGRRGDRTAPRVVRRGATSRRRDGHARYDSLPAGSCGRRSTVVVRSEAVRIPDQYCRYTTCAPANATRPRSSRPPITTIASCPATRSSSPRRCRPRRPAIGRRLFAWKLEARTRIGRRIG